MVKTFEYNGKNTSENFVKLSLKQNFKLCTVFSFGQHMYRGNRFLTTL